MKAGQLHTCSKGLLFVCFFLLPAAIRAQAPNLFSSADKNSILIGEPVTITVKTKIPSAAGNLSATLRLPDSIPHFELIGVDEPQNSSSGDTGKTITQQVHITSFDSGQWVIPAFRVSLSRPDGSSMDPLLTDSFNVLVNYSPADSSNKPRDIKPIDEVNYTDLTWLYITGAVLGGIALLLLAWWYWRNRKKKVEGATGSALSAIEEAMKALEELRKSDLSQPASIKQYHDRLADILRRYLGRKLQQNLSPCTTGDLLMVVKARITNQEPVAQLATILRCSDAVKFAKYLPPVYESENALAETVNLIPHLETIFNQQAT